MASRIASSLAAACLLVAFAHPARASDEPSANDKNLAQSLFDQARALMDKGAIADACPRFADSERLDPGGGHRPRSRALLREARQARARVRHVQRSHQPLITEQRHEREKFARDRAAALAPRLPRLTLKVTDAPPAAEVRLDGTRVPESAWGTATAVDPGEHAIEATAPDRAPSKIAVDDGGRRSARRRRHVGRVAAARARASRGLRRHPRASYGCPRRNLPRSSNTIVRPRSTRSARSVSRR